MNNQFITRKKSLDFLSRKKSLEEEVQLLNWMISIEHRTDMKNKIKEYLSQIERELLSLLK